MSGDLVTAIRQLAETTNANVGDARWYWFGSAREDWSKAADIDLLVVCENHLLADKVRHFVDPDQLCRPVHLSILTREEEEEIGFVKRQKCTRIL